MRVMVEAGSSRQQLPPNNDVSVFSYPQLFIYCKIVVKCGHTKVTNISSSEFWLNLYFSVYVFREQSSVFSFNFSACLMMIHLLVWYPSSKSSKLKSAAILHPKNLRITADFLRILKKKN